MANTHERNSGPAASALVAMNRIGIAVLLISGFAASASASIRDFDINIAPVFQSSGSWPNQPIAIEIENKGPNARGEVIVSDEGDTTRYPVELPTGTKKRLVVYGSGSAYGMPPQYILDTDQGRTELVYTERGSYMYEGGGVIAMVTDTPGDLGFLRQSNENRSGQPTLYWDAYVTPENAPERPVGYQGLAGIVLGPGAERLTDRSVRAIKFYALTGGTVIVVGGASASYLSDPRWRGVLPAADFQTKVLPGSKVLSDIAGEPFREDLTISAGRLLPDAKGTLDNGVPMVAERAYGLGKFIFFAFNPFEDPLIRWSGRKRLFATNVRTLAANGSTGFLNSYMGFTNYGYDPYGSSAPYGSTSPPRPYGTPYIERSDPFSVTLPPTSKVFWILAAFFITVVPVNFLILRKLGKGEWAWITAPVISLAFAGIFLNQASDLYSASLSKATNGVFLIQQGTNEAMFVGQSQIFFPNGGSYDLKMQGVDQIGVNDYDSYRGYGEPNNRTQVNPVDVGEVRISNLRASNLSFEQIAYRQLFPSKIQFQIEAKQIGPDAATIRIKNLAGFPLENPSVVVFGRSYPFESLDPGQSVSVQVDLNPDKNNLQFLESLSLGEKIAILKTGYTNAAAGPQIGATVTRRSSTQLLYFAPISIGRGGK
jgi:hypothetical protein